MIRSIFFKFIFSRSGSLEKIIFFLSIVIVFLFAAIFLFHLPWTESCSINSELIAASPLTSLTKDTFMSLSMSSLNSNLPILPSPLIAIFMLVIYIIPKLII